jgi:hypothetical protein
MGETLQQVTPSFNRSLRIESRTDRLTGDPGAVVLRELLERSGILGWMTARLKDPRSQVDVTHDLASLIRTCVLLSAQGWRDHDDADALRQDPAFRLAASSAAGLTPLGGPGPAKNEPGGATAPANYRPRPLIDPEKGHRGLRNRPEPRSERGSMNISGSAHPCRSDDTGGRLCGLSWWREQQVSLLVQPHPHADQAVQGGVGVDEGVQRLVAFAVALGLP